MKRRNKVHVEHVEIKVKSSTKSLIIKYLKEAEDGLTFGEIYQKFPSLSQRTLREHMQTFKQNNLLVLLSCRCHAATVYYWK
jgi:DNA-binding HxlR family transcriptional regulator